MEHLNQADQHRRTPLHMAAFFGKADAVWNARRWRPVMSCELLVVGQRIDLDGDFCREIGTVFFFVVDEKLG